MDGAINRMIESLTAVSKMSNTEDTGFAYGTIRSLNPLSILIDGHSEPLTEEFFILSQNVKPHKVTIPHKHEYNGETDEGDAITKQITNDVHDGINNEDYVILDIYPPLSVNDRVLMLRSNNGQKYYVLERI